MYSLIMILAGAILLALIGLRLKSSSLKTATARFRHWSFTTSREGQSQDTLHIESLSSFDWSVTEPLKLRTFKPVYFITMAMSGVRTAKPADLIMIDHNYLERLEIRQETLRNHAEKTLGCLPVGTAAVQEVYSYLLDSYLPVRYPLMFMKDEKKFFNRVTNTAFPLVPPADPVEALRLMAANVEDDMFILQQEPQGHRCIAAMCTSPSGFDPSQKLGKLLKDIHAPVPAYDKIGPSMEKYFSRVEVGKNAVRNNWSVTTTPDLFNVATNHIKEDDPIEEDINVDISKVKCYVYFNQGHLSDILQAILRCELQTLSRLPKTRALLFSFKTFTYPIEDIKAEGLGPQLADAIEGLKSGNAEGMWIYKGGVRWGKSVCEYLRA
ncbi:hypothetical protein BKA67DRAFT_582327 [Truncatella angustata]|uniref:Uncharacterized protein n=1 Tax=Truncatella angustata TaxID=152316 RepID=A0A9P8UCG7_9PEZI|nr:uncharacterized protein BKA67DRAFT_582327 [Truncatella angustata]KAH6645772.1 hypothetical protein BKA67DRAFT_582327 [Truncatella angustata]